MNLKRLRSLLAILFLFHTFTSYAFEVNPKLSGSWFNPDQPGHGLSIEVISKDLTVIYWYVYNPDGKPTFLIAVGENQGGGRIEATAYHNTGMVWGEFNPATRMETKWGVITLDFSDCKNGSLSWRSDDLSVQPIPFGEGTMSIQRLASIDDGICAESPYAGIYKGYLLSENLDEEYTAIALLSTDGHFTLFTEDHIAISAQYTVNDDDPNDIGLDIDGSAFSMDTSQVISQVLEVFGAIHPGYRFVMDYGVGFYDSGTMDFYPINALYWRGLTLDGITGTYLTEEDSATTTINPDGSFTGSDALGCIWSGQITIPDTRFNLLDIDVTVGSCDEDNGSYTGHGYTTDAIKLNDGLAMRIFGFNSERTVDMTMIRSNGG
ncbi:MAG: hypothetical protein QNK19_04430 [Xanthomonadales bacterium]|nr:hypothetical protein [Xanthomonadales bacterium]